MAYKVSELKSYFKFPLLQEKQRSVRVSDMLHQMGELQEELRRVKDERCGTLEESAELKKMIGDSKDRFSLIESHAIKAKGLERKAYELMVSQKKELEQAKVFLEESKSEIKSLKESIRKMERSAIPGDKSTSKKVGSFKSIPTQQEISNLRTELRLALEADDKSKEALDDFSIILKEVSADADQVKAVLSVEQAELDKATEEAKNLSYLLQSTAQKLGDSINGHDKLELELKESMSTMNEKEDSLLSCLTTSEEEIAKWKQENSRLKDVWNVAREDNTKLRLTMKQTVNEVIALKEVLEIVRSENSQMKVQLLEKGKASQQIKQDYEGLKLSEAAALDSVRELNSYLASVSVANLKRSSDLSEVGSFRLPQSSIPDARVRRSTKKFSSERWKSNSNFICNGHRHSTEERGVVNSPYDRERAIESSGSIMFSSFRKVSDNQASFCGETGTCETGTVDTYTCEHLAGKQRSSMDNMNLKKHKTFFGRIGDAIRRKSFHK